MPASRSASTPAARRRGFRRRRRERFPSRAASELWPRRHRGPASRAPASTTPAESQVTWVWGAAPGGSPTVVTGNRPSFFVAYTELADVNLSEVVPAIVRVAAGTGGWRVIGYSAGRPDAPARDDGSWVIVRDLKQDAVASTLSGSGPGLVDIRPREALAPGEYAVVLRPAVAKPYSGRELLGEYRHRPRLPRRLDIPHPLTVPTPHASCPAFEVDVQV